MKIEAIESIFSHVKSSPSRLELYQAPLSEQQILELQETMLTNGFQFIKCANMASGRSLMYDFLRSLNCYHEVGCLTDQPASLISSVTDIKQDLLLYGYLDTANTNYLEGYFVDHFYFDFIWIEASDSLLNLPWFIDFERKIKDLQMHRTIPVIVLIG